MPPPTPGYVPIAQPKSSTLRKSMLITVAIVFGLFVVTRFVDVGSSKAPLKPPATLAGRVRSTNAELAVRAASVSAELKKENNGRSSSVVFYESAGRPEIVLIAVRARTSESRDVKDAIAGGFPIDASSKQKIDGLSCYRTDDKSMGLCMWQDTVSGFVVTLADGDLDNTAAAANEARDALE